MHLHTYKRAFRLYNTHLNDTHSTSSSVGGQLALQYLVTGSVCVARATQTRCGRRTTIMAQHVFLCEKAVRNLSTCTGYVQCNGPENSSAQYRRVWRGRVNVRPLIASHIEKTMMVFVGNFLCILAEYY